MNNVLALKIDLRMREIKYLKNQKKYEIFLKSKRQFRKEWTDKLRLDF